MIGVKRKGRSFDGLLSIKESALKILLTAMMVFSLMATSSTCVFADEDTQASQRVDADSFNTYIINHVEFIGGTVANKGLPTSVWNNLLIDYNETVPPQGYTSAGIKQNNGVTAYIFYPTDKQEKMIKDINNQNSYNAAQQKVNNIETELGLQADTAGASEALSGITPMVSLITGVLVILLTAFMLVFTAIDCVYIAFPAFRNKCEEAKASGNKFATKTGKDGESTLRWVTDDAQYAIETGTIDSGKNKWLIYLKRRIISYIALGIVIFMFFTGNITLLIEVAIKLVSGLMNVLSGFGA